MVAKKIMRSLTNFMYILILLHTYWVGFHFLGFFAGIYSLILLILGTEKLHGISRRRAILMYVIPAAILALFAIVGLIFAMTLFSSLPLTGQLQ